MRSKSALAIAALLLCLAGAYWVWFEYNEYHTDCCAPPDDLPEGYTPPLVAAEEREKLGVMSSLPLLWPIDADVTAIADGSAQFPWQAAIFNAEHEVVALDTLSPVPDLDPRAPKLHPLAKLDRLAVIQPRALTPQDNVSLDNWVRAGGRLLLVLDPLLTGQYDLALGDPRRPADTALIPPVLARWGLEMSFAEDQLPARRVPMPFAPTGYTVFRAGELNAIENSGDACQIEGRGTLAVCRIGEGRVTVLADAGLIEHGPNPSSKLASREISNDLEGEDLYREFRRRGVDPFNALLRFAFSD